MQNTFERRFSVEPNASRSSSRLSRRISRSRSPAFSPHVAPAFGFVHASDGNSAQIIFPPPPRRLVPTPPHLCLQRPPQPLREVFVKVIGRLVPHAHRVPQLDQQFGVDCLWMRLDQVNLQPSRVGAYGKGKRSSDYSTTTVCEGRRENLNRFLAFIGESVLVSHGD